MIRWALVAFVIAILASVVEIADRGTAAFIAGDVAIAAFLFGLIVTLITWISRNQMDEDSAVGKPWKP